MITIPYVFQRLANDHENHEMSFGHTLKNFQYISIKQIQSKLDGLKMMTVRTLGSQLDGWEVVNLSVLMAGFATLKRQKVMKIMKPILKPRWDQRVSWWNSENFGNDSRDIFGVIFFE